MRAYGAVLVFFVVGTAVAAVAAGLLRLVQPDSTLSRRDRLPDWWLRLTSWSRSRSLRVWCPSSRVEAAVTAHLQTDDGRRLSRLGVSIALGSWDADVVVVERGDADRLDAFRSRAPQPVASVVLTDVTDRAEFRDAMTRLAAALRWPDAPADRVDPDTPDAAPAGAAIVAASGGHDQQELAPSPENGTDAGDGAIAEDETGTRTADPHREDES